MLRTAERTLLLSLDWGTRTDNFLDLFSKVGFTTSAGAAEGAATTTGVCAAGATAASCWGAATAFELSEFARRDSASARSLSISASDKPSTEAAILLVGQMHSFVK